MKNYKGISRALIIALMASMAVSGCSKKETSTLQEETTQISTSDTITIETAAEENESTEESIAETEEIEEVLAEGQMRSILTGEVIDVEVGSKRPVAVMINNIQEATPQQCGTSEAEVLYEAVVEGQITRMMAVFQDTSKIEKLGTIRSARHYFMDFANNFNAIYCHYGQSIYVTRRLEAEGLRTVSQNIGSAYIADKQYPAPHHIFTTDEKLEAGISAIGVEREMSTDYPSCFAFYANDTEPEGAAANSISIPFKFSKPKLEYDAETKLYKKDQYGAPHVDANTGEQLAFKNVIVQFARYEDIVGGSGCQEVYLNEGGKGLYLTDGKVVNITWRRESPSSPIIYYNEDGSQLKMNRGKTYIAVVPTNYDVTVSE